jgi:hypothetical protein
MKEYRVTNRTQGRLELKSIRKVLDAGESTIVAEPIPDDIKFMIGGGPYRLIDVKELPGPVSKKTLSSSAPQDFSTQSPQTELRPRRSKSE